jgi:hypothetical protein
VVVLALIPPRCRCLVDLRKLTVQASEAKTLIYLVGVHDARLSTLTRALGLGATQALEDTANALPGPYRVAALTAVVVRLDGSALKVVPDRHGFQNLIQDDVRALVTGSTATLEPASAAPAAPTASAAPGTSSAPAG